MRPPLKQICAGPSIRYGLREAAHPFDFKPDSQGYTHFAIELIVRDGQDELARTRFSIRGAPAIGGGRVVWVNGKQVAGRTEPFVSQSVVVHIVSEMQKAM